MKKMAILGLVIGMLIAGGGVYAVMSGRGLEIGRSLQDTMTRLKEVTELRDAANAKVADLEQVIEERDRTLLGYTEYKKYLQAGKKQLSGETKLVTASVTRPEAYTKYLTSSFFGLKSNGAVKVTYKSEYNFGFDLRPDGYDVRAAGSGIEIIVGRPRLIGTPAVSDMKHEVLSGGFFTDEAQAIIGLQQEASKRTKEQGLAMAKQQEIVALCEKRLVAFLHDFLAKQPNVELVPQITVIYR